MHACVCLCVSFRFFSLRVFICATFPPFFGNCCISMQGVCVSILCVSVCVSALLHSAISQLPTESDTHTVRMDDLLYLLISSSGFFFFFASPLRVCDLFSRYDIKSRGHLSSLPANLIWAVLLITICVIWLKKKRKKKSHNLQHSSRLLWSTTYCKITK